ncbi:hypothetical protein L218DRAFT_1001820 [Marasmius fiardii PR-910]|nr:hypothetical protein L218DRAFT_1001820 [Marasmius fiardii PR-910]
MCYMFKHEPFEILPPAYWPWREVEHEPPIFEYGVALTIEETDDYARHEVFTEGKKPSRDFQDVLFGITKKFSDDFRVDLGAGVYVRVPITKERGVTLMLSTTDNYSCLILGEKIDAVCEGLEKAFGKTPKWYLSGQNKSFKTDYDIPDWKLNRLGR